jgi:nucleotide-binding universal stress UspA family protein
MEYKTLVCPIDNTELSEKALRHAGYVSKVSRAKIVLVHVVEKCRRAGHVVTDSDEWGVIHRGWLDEGRAVLASSAEMLRAQGVLHADTVLREGEASREIVAVAEEHKADMIVMSTHRYSAIGKLFAGSITDYVTRHSPCPVLWVF